MNFNKTLYRSLAVQHIGCEAPRAYFIPYQSENISDGDITLSGSGLFAIITISLSQALFKSSSLSVVLLS